jgi:hypothetical protein
LCCGKFLAFGKLYFARTSQREALGVCLLRVDGDEAGGRLHGFDARLDCLNQDGVLGVNEAAPDPEVDTCYGDGSVRLHGFELAGRFDAGDVDIAEEDFVEDRGVLRRGWGGALGTGCGEKKGERKGRGVPR